MTSKKSSLPTESEERYFVREASAVAMLLKEGLKSLDPPGSDNDGVRSGSLFMVSVGLERLLRLLFIFQFRHENNSALPDNSLLRSHGSEIQEIYENSLMLSKSLGRGGQSITLESDELYPRIIDFFREFSKGNRYYNLNLLKAPKDGPMESLDYWTEYIAPLIISRHSQPADLSIRLASAIKKNRTIEREYSRFYILNIISYLVELLVFLENPKTESAFRNNFLPLLSGGAIAEEIKKKLAAL